MTDDKNERFLAWYEQYVERIYRFVYLKVSSQEIAEDVTSEVFLQSWRRSDSIEQPQAFFYQVARNLIADYYRSGKIRMFSLEHAETVIDDTPSQDELAAEQFELEQVKAALGEMNEDYQNFIIWYYLEELTVPEIQEITGKSEGSVRVGIHRALRALKSQINLQRTAPSSQETEKTGSDAVIQERVFPT